MIGSDHAPFRQRRPYGWIAIALLLAVGAIALAAYGSPSHPASLEDRTLALAAQLRCPVCEGQSVADSQSAIAAAMRTLIRKDLARGESEDQIKATLLASYPDISLAPSNSGIGGIAWFAPPLLLLGGVALLTILILDWRNRGREKHPEGTRQVTSRYLDLVRAELAGEEGSGE